MSNPCNPMDCSPTTSSVHGIVQARILEWVAVSYSRGSSQPRDKTHVSCISCIGRWILHHWATRETQHVFPSSLKLLLLSWQCIEAQRGHWKEFFKSTCSPSVQFSSIQSLSHVWLLATPWTTAHQASLSITNSWSLPKLMSIESVMPSIHLILHRPLFLLPSIFQSILTSWWTLSKLRCMSPQWSDRNLSEDSVAAKFTWW